MNKDIFADLVWKSQSGDTDALEQLLLQAHTPVHYLTEKILQDEDSARHVTREVLEIISSKLNSLSNPEEFEKWMCRITAARCIQAMPLYAQETAESGTAVWQEELTDGQVLTEEESASIIQQMVESLPERQRLCILLLCCGGLTIHAIAQLTGFSLETVKDYINHGQQTVQDHLWDLQTRDIQFTGLTSLAGILHIAMYQKSEDTDPIPLVYGILGKEIPNPEKRIIRILTCILIALVVAILIACGVLFMMMRPDPEPAATIPTTAETAAPTEAATEVTTVSTEPEPTVPETTAATTEATEEVMPAAETTIPAATETIPVSAGNTPAAGNTTGVPSDAPKTGEDGHTHRYLTTRTGFNCETGGQKRYLCADCDYYYTVELAPTGSHSYTTQPSSDATCTKAAQVYLYCSKCGNGIITDDTNNPALGHSYESTVVAPTTSSQGYTQHKCSHCGNTYQDAFVDALPGQTEAPAPSTEAPAPSTEAPAPPAEEPVPPAEDAVTEE